MRTCHPKFEGWKILLWFPKSTRYKGICDPKRRLSLPPIQNLIEEQPHRRSLGICTIVFGVFLMEKSEQSSRFGLCKEEEIIDFCKIRFNSRSLSFYLAAQGSSKLPLCLIMRSGRCSISAVHDSLCVADCFLETAGKRSVASLVRRGTFFALSKRRPPIVMQHMKQEKTRPAQTGLLIAPLPSLIDLILCVGNTHTISYDSLRKRPRITEQL